MTANDWVTCLSLVAGVISFALYAYEAFVAIGAKSAAPDLGSSPEVKAMIANPAASVKDLSDLVDAIARLTDSLAKAGPALTSIIGAVLFFAIAAISSGALHGSATTSAAANTTVPAK